ncbi:hypothetical protein EGW08_004462 [Elysia chlorotica]|uniref:SAP domain-containing protein n=1 Tax=Elysia chlorotica TaxID=188477 RepID=A0A3S0ZVK0_ELYCH|nr:hypothetical protein EGW08_004462 [Elysia chlorotica]
MADTSTMEDLKKMKVTELKQALKDRGLPISGTKPELIKRLCSALGTEVDQGEEDIDDDDDDVLEDDILNDDAPVPAPAKAPAQQAAAKPTPAVAVKAAITKPVTAPDQTKQLTERKETNNIAPTDTTVTSKPVQVDKLTAEERLKMRAEKFGAVSLDVKKQLRAERFGLDTGNKTSSLSSPASKTPMSAEEVERLKKRAERFGAVTSKSLSKADQDERKRKRAERFGISNTSTVKTTVSVNSTDSDLEAKKKKRAERFGKAT